MSPTAPRSRRPRFRRPAEPPPMQLTERDLAILAAHLEWRFLRSDQVPALFAEASPKKIIERLGVLQSHGYLDRPPAQAELYRAGGGSAPIIHAIGNRGARALAEHTQVDPGRLTWLRKNTHASRLYLEHTTTIAQIAIKLIVATRPRQPAVRLLMRDELVATLPAETRDAVSPFKLSARLVHGDGAHEAAVVPDLAALLTFADGTRRALFFELDRGTMPIVRAGPHGTSLMKKCAVYSAARAGGLVQQRLGWKTFRTVIITNTINPAPIDPASRRSPAVAGAAQRAANIREALRTTPGVHADLFLVGEQPAVLDSEDILAFPWTAPDGRSHRLLP